MCSKIWNFPFLIVASIAINIWIARTAKVDDFIVDVLDSSRVFVEKFNELVPMELDAGRFGLSGHVGKIPIRYETGLMLQSQSSLWLYVYSSLSI